MSYLGSILEFVQHLCLEDSEINNMTREIEETNRENTKFENHLEEIDREHLRLQIELYNLQSITSHNNIQALDDFQQTSMKMLKESIELNSLIEKIDFTKILQCHHMEMEAKYLREWQPIQDCFVKTLKWHDEMEKRDIVQKYRQAEVAQRQTEETEKTELASMKISLKQSAESLQQAKGKRNAIIVYLVKGSRDVESLRENCVKLTQYQVYLDELRQEKLKLRLQLEQTQLKSFNPNLRSNNTSDNIPTNPKQTIEAINYIMPKLPSFTDILKSFNQTDQQTNITTIENTTNICVKSILHNSSNNQTITKKQTKNVRFKVQLEEYQEDITQTVFHTESESELENDMSEAQSAMEVVNEQTEENLQEMIDLAKDNEIETIDLLTPAENLMETQNKKQLHEMDSSNYEPSTKQEFNKKPLVEIQECIVFKTPFPLQEVPMLQDQERNSNYTAGSSKQSVNSFSCSRSSNADVKDILNTTKISFYEEFSNVSTSVEVSPHLPTNNSNNKTSVLKDFEAFFNDNKDYLFNSKESNEEEPLKQMAKTNSNNEAQDFLDFGSSRGFTFDSDDNMTENAGNMDFM